jgi:hypothetical protein
MRTPSQGPIYQELGRLKLSGGLDPLVAPFMQDTKPAEELYDVIADPHQVFNLASDPMYAGQLKLLREELTDWMRKMDDKGLVPEPELYRRMFENEDSGVTAVPLLTKSPGSDGSVTVTIETHAEGASLAYRIVPKGADAPRGGWLLYTGAVRLKQGESLEAVASQLGFADSPAAALTN